MVVPAASENARELADRIRRALDSVGDRWPGISAAVGVSIGGPDRDDVEDLIARADAAMLRSARSGAADGHRRRNPETAP